jgi:hypothetical protein
MGRKCSISLPSFIRINSFQFKLIQKIKNMSSHGKELFKSFWLNADTEIIIYGATEPVCEIDIGRTSVKIVWQNVLFIKLLSSERR